MLSYGGVELTLPTPQQVAWLSSSFTLRRLNEFSRVFWPLNRTPWLTFPGQTLDRPLKLGALTWPLGASRFATFYAVVDDATLDGIRSAGAPAEPLPLIMQWDDEVTLSAPASISTSLWMLPPLPLSQIGGSIGHSLLTLVDDRYWWWFKSVGVLTCDGYSTSWDNLYTQLAAATGISLTWDAIDPAYLLPSDLLATNYEYLPLLLDAIAYNVGQRIVVHLDGNVVGRSVLEGPADVAANLALPAARSLMAGGAFLESDVLASIPQAAAVTFPEIGVAAPYVAAGATGGTAAGTKIFHDTAVYDGANAVLLQSLATRVALDYGAASTQGGDWKFCGIVPWVPDPTHDAVEWVYAAEGGPGARGEVSTRIYPAPWNDLTDQLLHGSEAGSQSGGCCQTTIINEGDSGIVVVNDCQLRSSPGFTSQTLIYNVCDNTLNLWVCPTGSSAGCYWVWWCPCGSATGSGSGSATGSGTGCVAGTCNLCSNPPFVWTINVGGFTGTLSALNGQWVLYSQDNCRWSALKTIAGVVYYASYVVTSTDEILGFVDITHNAELAVYHSRKGVQPFPGDCCSPMTLFLWSFLQGGTGGGTNNSCTSCLTNKTPLVWTVTLSGFTGDFAWANRSWSAAWSSACAWQVQDSSGNTVTVNAFDTAGAADLQLELLPSGGGLMRYYQDAGTMTDCCTPQSLKKDPDSTSGTGGGPQTILLTPDCETGDNDAPAELIATPTCCQSGTGTGTGTGSGGHGAVTPCCPGGVPTTLYARFTGSLAGIGTVQLTWDGTSWKSGAVAIPCVTASGLSFPGTINFTCNAGINQFRLACSTGAFFDLTAAATACSPFSWTASGTEVVMPFPPCTTGAFTATVTPT